MHPNRCYTNGDARLQARAILPSLLCVKTVQSLPMSGTGAFRSPTMTLYGIWMTDFHLLNPIRLPHQTEVSLDTSFDGYGPI